MISLNTARFDIRPASLHEDIDSGEQYLLMVYQYRKGPGMPWKEIQTQWNLEHVSLLFFADELEAAIDKDIQQTIEICIGMEPAGAIYEGNVTETAMRNYILRRNGA